MRRLICAFVVRICHVFSWLGSRYIISYSMSLREHNRTNLIHFKPVGRGGENKLTDTGWRLKTLLTHVIDEHHTHVRRFFRAGHQDFDFEVCMSLVTSWCHFSAKPYDANILERSQTEHFLIEKCSYFYVQLIQQYIFKSKCNCWSKSITQDDCSASCSSKWTFWYITALSHKEKLRDDISYCTISSRLFYGWT